MRFLQRWCCYSGGCGWAKRWLNVQLFARIWRGVWASFGERTFRIDDKVMHGQVV